MKIRAKKVRKQKTMLDVSCECQTKKGIVAEGSAFHQKVERGSIVCGRCGTELQLGTKWEETPDKGDSMGLGFRARNITRWVGMAVAMDHRAKVGRKALQVLSKKMGKRKAMEAASKMDFEELLKASRGK